MKLIAARLNVGDEDPASFIEQVLISPYDGQPYRLVDAERQFIKHAFQLDADGRLLYPLLLYSAPKKSRKTELAALLTITLMVLYGGQYGEAYVVANNREQAIDRAFTGIKRILEASPLLQNEVKSTQDRILFNTAQSTITAIPNEAAGLSGCHPTISVFDKAGQPPAANAGAG